MKRYFAIALLALLLGSCASSGLSEKGPSAGGRSDEMATVPEGVFRMGMNGAETNERPEHMVFLSGFDIDRYEVSAADFARFLNEKGNKGNEYFTADDSSTIVEAQGAKGIDSSSRRSYAPRNGFRNYPANNVSWLGAYEYCRWKGRRLPTEAEWEKAARGADERRYPWGDEAPEDTKARYDQEAVKGPEALVPVDSLREGVSSYGVYNMAGNVLEWVNDWYRQNYCDFCGQSGEQYVEAASDLLCADSRIFTDRTGAKKPGAADYSDPQGPAIGSFKVLRGGSWHDDSMSALGSTRRFWLGPEERYAYTGFRCASGGTKAMPVATPSEVQKALIKCRPEEVKHGAVYNNGTPLHADKVVDKMQPLGYK